MILDYSQDNIFPSIFLVVPMCWDIVDIDASF